MKTSSKKMYKDITGKIFGRLTVVAFDGYYGPRYKTMWKCRCICGKITKVRGEALKRGDTKSCGCLQREIARKNGKMGILPNGGYARNTIIGNYKRRANRFNKKWELNIVQLEKLFHGNCYYCGIPPTQILKAKQSSYLYNGIDRIDSTKGYTINNVVSCCKTCNYAKRIMTIEEFSIWIRKIYNHMEKTWQPSK